MFHDRSNVPGHGRLLLRSLFHHRRSHAGSVLGAAVACAVLAGALAVGDSVRESLRGLAVDRLGLADQALRAQTPFRLDLTGALAGSPEVSGRFEPPEAAVLVRGSASSPRPDGSSGPKVTGVTVLGIGDGALAMLSPSGRPAPPAPKGRRALVNGRLAEDLGIRAGDAIDLLLPDWSAIPGEALAGRREDTTRSVRLEVEAVLPDGGAGDFSLDAAGRSPRNVLVDREEISRALHLRGRANLLLLRARPGDPAAAGERGSRFLDDALRSLAAAEDLGLRIRRRDAIGFLQVESEAFQIEPSIEDGIRAAAREIGAPFASVSTYLAARISLERGDGKRAEIPYSTITALDPSAPPPLGPIPLASGGPARPLAPGEMLLGAWAARDLGAAVGDPVVLDYLLVRRDGGLEPARAPFRVAGIAVDSPLSLDPGLTPEFPGLTSSARMSDWDPPFPVDLKRIRPADEEYWKDHRAAPKAFVGLEEGRRLWGSRFGSATSVRSGPAPGRTLAETEALLREKLREMLDPAALGLSFRPVREEAIEASRGSTDFAQLFIAFSAFLIAAAAILVGLFWGIGLERRAREWGVLRSVGFGGRSVRRLAVLEGLLVAGIGCVAGLALVPPYAAFLLDGLRSRWSDAMRPPRLDLHLEPGSLAIGLAATLTVVLAAIAIASRRIGRTSPMSLLSGRVGREAADAVLDPGAAKPFAACRASLVASLLLALAAALTIPSLISERSASRHGPAAFFLAGTAILVAGVLFLAAGLRTSRPGKVRVPKRFSSVLWLGVRELRRRRGRSILTVALMASGAFVIAAAGALGTGEEAGAGGKDSGTSGFTHAAWSDLPVFKGLDDPRARSDLGVPDSLDGRPISWEGFEAFPFRVEEGDDASCLNLYRAKRPRILGAPEAFLRRGGFRFRASLAAGPEETANPWRILDRSAGEAPPAEVPAIADEATATWGLHLALGESIEVDRGGGEKVRLRLAGLLEGSILQGVLFVSERDFLAAFPRSSGSRFFLLAAPEAEAGRIARVLAEGLEPFGFDPVPADRLLEEYRSVERAYLATFQLLGGLGLLLGSAGLGAVLLRGILERRGELALLRALGFRRRTLMAAVVAQDAALAGLGLGLGSLAAVIAAAPHLGRAPWFDLGLTLLGAMAVGLLSGGLAAVATLRAPIVSAIRAE